jgi:hypothetical protein
MLFYSTCPSKLPWLLLSQTQTKNTSKLTLEPIQINAIYVPMAAWTQGTSKCAQHSCTPDFRKTLKSSGSSSKHLSTGQHGRQQNCQQSVVDEDYSLVPKGSQHS